MIKAQGIPTIPADSFVESIGVNTYWTYRNVCTQNYTGLKAKLGEAGIRYVRDGANQPTYTRANDLQKGFVTNAFYNTALRFQEGFIQYCLLIGKQFLIPN
jgi:hypothetical protein